MNFKKKEVIRAVIVIILIVLTIILIKCVQGCDSIKKELQKKGYTKEEIITIKEKLSDQDIQKVLELEKQDKLVDIIKEPYYIPDNLMTYLEQAKQNKSISDIISTVNVNSYQNWYTNPKEADISKGMTMLVNKFNYLKEDYTVEDIVNIPLMYAYDGHSIQREVYNQYVKMWNAANKEGLTLIVNSSFRTYQKQQQEYNASNDDYAARPGFSEHQTGLALDIVSHGSIGNQFEETAEFRWLQDNAYKYGFILRYPKDKEYITGYEYESWHYRYVGVDMAAKVKESNLTYDEYYAYYCDYKKEC